MRLLIAATGGFTAYLITALMLGTAPTFGRPARPARPRRLATWLTQTGSGLSPVQFVAGSAGIGAAAWLLLTLVTGDAFTGFFPALATSGALAWTHHRRRIERLQTIREAWPDAIRHLLAYVRSGATVPLAVSSLASEGPEPLRDVFAGWDERARLLGFVPALETIRAALSDPTSDRVIEVLVIAHQWGGELVADVLSDLATEVTEDLRTEQTIRAEGTTQRIEAWVIGIVPWLLLVYLTAGQIEYRTFYQSGQGRVVIIGAGLWWAMGLLALGALKRAGAEPRVLHTGSTR